MEIRATVSETVFRHSPFESFSGEGVDCWRPTALYTTGLLLPSMSKLLRIQNPRCPSLLPVLELVPFLAVVGAKVLKLAVNLSGRPAVDDLSANRAAAEREGLPVVWQFSGALLLRNRRLRRRWGGMIIFYRGGCYVTRYVTFVTFPVPVPGLPDSGGAFLRIGFQCVSDRKNVVAGQSALN
ncbi:hypothetical protein [Sphingosinicella xenopeptidilytica]|uniref:hypothetical protein n=1 Tax=Sphingosinicella xenopeptidilytica TaxID=364098 RepID=UPI0036D2A212